MNMTREHYPQAGNYVATWRKVKQYAASNPDARLHVPGDFDSTPARLYAEYCAALDRRINARAGVKPAGRKDTPAYFIDCQRDQRDIQQHVTSRVRIYQLLTAECRKRFAHMLTDRRDVF